MAFKNIGKSLVKVFGSRNERLVKAYRTIALQAGAFEDEFKQLDDEGLKSKTDEFKTAIKNGTSPNQILPQAFALVREAARRNVEMRHFDVQLIGGNVLYDGKIAEMATGEGKTLVATLAAYLVYLTGRKVHLITVNDYLAARDAQWMKPVYNALGMTVGAIQGDMDTAGDDRKQQYACDITYGTNNEFGFDYLRDNMKMSLEQMVQPKLEYSIIDEVDSILIDEARTPLIISGPAFDDVTRYKKADQVARKLISMQSNYDNIKNKIDSLERTIANAQGELSDAKKEKNSDRTKKAQDVINKSQKDLAQAQAQLESATQYYEVEFDKKAAHLTHEGIGAAQEQAGVGSFFTGSNMEWPHLLEQSLRAHITFEREKDYVVKDGKVVIVDEFTGRLMEGRQWSDGLHQAVEAKEGVTVKEESQTLATVTLQNFFKLYGQLAGMTGTAMTEAEEFMKIYKLEVISIPTNEPCVRDDREDVVYKSLKEKFTAITDEINQVSAQGRPVLVGTVSIEKSEAISLALTKRFGVEHEVLNAKQHQREATIVEKAGFQHKARDGKTRGNVTIATNMAGRGTDIKLTEEVEKLGGLHILGTERHESRRIDNQLRGRAGRQGDAGSSQFFLSFEDDLMRIFSPDWTIKALTRIGWEEGQPIYHKWITNGIEKAQKKVEERNFEIRKALLEYDEVMDYQRNIFYTRRRQIISGQDLKNVIEEMIDSAIENICGTILKEDYPYRCILEWAATNFNVELKLSDIKNMDSGEIESLIKDRTKEQAAAQVSISLGEYLEDYEDPATWNVSDLCKWAMSTFSVSLSPSKVKKLSPEEIEDQLVDAAAVQIDKKDCSQLIEFSKEDFALRTFTNALGAKFDINLDINQLKDISSSDSQKYVSEKVNDRYRRKEIEYPVEFAMSMVYGPQGPNVYAFETLAQWANKKYNADFTPEKLQDMKPSNLHDKLTQLSESYNNGKLTELITEKTADLEPDQLAKWANERFDASLTPDDLAEPETSKNILTKTAKDFLRSELSDLERYVLLQIFDSTWKDHLYNMDHLKSNIHFRSFAEKDPKVEYKREGFRMFTEMLDSIEDKVTDTIFKVHLEAGVSAKSVWNVSQTAHDEVGQFEMAERQRAAAQAPQAEQQVVKQIKLDQPKVGRNDPCPCGSGKKYKKCCGRST